MGTEGLRGKIYTLLSEIKNKDVFMGDDSIIYNSEFKENNGDDQSMPAVTVRGGALTTHHMLRNCLSH